MYVVFIQNICLLVWAQALRFGAIFVVHILCWISIYILINFNVLILVEPIEALYALLGVLRYGMLVQIRNGQGTSLTDAFLILSWLLAWRRCHPRA